MTGSLYVILLGVMWLAARLALQPRLNAGHRAWLLARQLDRNKKLSGHHVVVPRLPEEVPGLSREKYDELTRQWVDLGLKDLGSYEDETQSRVFPNLRTVTRVHGQSDGTILATVAHMRERNLVRRLVLILRGRPWSWMLTELITEWPDGTVLVSGNGPGVVWKGPRPIVPKELTRVTLGTKASLADIWDAHRALLEIARDHGLPTPISTPTLDALLKRLEGRS